MPRSGKGTRAEIVRIAASVASSVIGRSALAIEAQRGVAALANTLGMGCAMRLAPRPEGAPHPTTSDRCRDTGPQCALRPEQKNDDGAGFIHTSRYTCAGNPRCNAATDTRACGKMETRLRRSGIGAAPSPCTTADPMSSTPAQDTPVAASPASEPVDENLAIIARQAIVNENRE